jgi:prephenate dehydrogenase
MNRYDTVAIIGVGLIGGSIGLALLKRQISRHVIGIGRNSNSLNKALAGGCVTKATTDLRTGVKQAQLIVVCTPVDQIAAHVAEAGRHCPFGSPITDVGSTKAAWIPAAEAGLISRFGTQVPFVGSHPIAGSEKTGPEAASADMFESRTVVVTPTPASDPDSTAAIECFWQLLGARVVRMNPEEHDRSLAYTSHLPHLVAAALAHSTPPDELDLTGTGWQDTTRIAAGDAELWRQILLANRGGTLLALADFERVLVEYRSALESADGAKLAELLAEGKRRRDAVGS